MQIFSKYLEIVEKAKKHCFRGDVFQLVLSRRFQQKFLGDEFNVYRALRNINPSPYLFFFDYGDYKLMGSSPESQLIIKNNKAVLIQEAADIINLLGWDDQPVKNPKPQISLFVQLTNEEKAITDLIKNLGQVPIDSIQQQTGLSSSALAAAILSLEMQHIIQSAQGKMYRLV